MHHIVTKRYLKRTILRMGKMLGINSMIGDMLFNLETMTGRPGSTSTCYQINDAMCG